MAASESNNIEIIYECFKEIRERILEQGVLSSIRNEIYQELICQNNKKLLDIYYNI